MVKLSKENIKLIIGMILLIISFLTISVFNYYYIRDNTNFFSQAESSMSTKGQVIDQNIMPLLISGIILFGIVSFLVKGMWKYFFSFLFDMLLLPMAAVTFLIGLFVPNIALNLRLGLIIAAFVIYISVDIARKHYEGEKRF